MQRQISYKGVAENDNSIIAMSLRLAEIFAKTEEHEKAELGFEFCIESMEKKIQSGNIQFFRRPCPKYNYTKILMRNQGGLESFYYF